MKGKILIHASDIWDAYFDGNYSNHRDINRLRSLWNEYLLEVGEIYTPDEIPNELPRENVLDSLAFSFRLDK